MIGMRVRVDKIAESQAMATGERFIAVNLAQFGVDQRGGAGVFAAHQVGSAPPAGNSLENHQPLDVSVLMTRLAPLQRQIFPCTGQASAWQPTVRDPPLPFAPRISR